MKNIIYKGLVGEGYGECDETICLNGEPIAETIQDDIRTHGDFLTVRYFVCDKECSLEQAKMDWVKTITGSGAAEYCQRYSEITGYLWTDQELNVGGHDLVEELTSTVGKYLILSIDYSKEDI